MIWTRQMHLERWADDTDSRVSLPALLRRLIRRVCPNAKINFPAFEQGYRPGFDGESITEQAHQYVPSGQAVWEMSSEQSPKSKASRDLEKRTREIPPERRKEMTFVFATPRTWQQQDRDKWIEENRDKGWKEIRVLDGSDLEQWIELAPDVDIWFAHQTGRPYQGARALSSYWDDLRSIADYPLAPLVFTASRTTELETISKWIAGPPDSLFLRSSGVTDGLDFLAALSGGPMEGPLQSAVVIDSIDAWRDLSASQLPLVLIGAPSLELQASDISKAVGQGHYVFVSGPRAIIRSERSIDLPRQSYFSVSDALVECGYSAAKAMSLAKASCGTSSVLKRLITKHPETVFPAWARDASRIQLAPFSLIGGWSFPDSPSKLGESIDLSVVTELVGISSGELASLVQMWRTGLDPLFIEFGRVTFVGSREDAWHLLGGFISAQTLELFRELATLVLEEDNPAFELAIDERWLASVRGKVHSMSAELRESLIESLALMTSRQPADPPSLGVDFAKTVRSILETILPRGASWKRWASFGNTLTVLAEADPTFFIERVETDLGSPEPELPKLFQDSSPSYFSSAVHSSLLWALEVMAWDEALLPRVAICLAQLAERDPGGTYANRPANSLREIFLSWLWHTNAPLDKRIAALREIISRSPIVGWKLLCQLLPSGSSGFSHNTQMPRWRPWADGWSREAIHPEVPKYYSELAKLAFETAQSKPLLWVDVFDSLLRISNEMTVAVFSALEMLAEKETDETTRTALWGVIRETLARHERHAGAPWAYSASIRDRLARIRDKLQPADHVSRNKWLFDNRAELPAPRRIDDYEGHEKALNAARLSALKAIIEQSGVPGVFRLLDVGADAGIVGWMLGFNNLIEWKDIEPAFLAGDASKALSQLSSWFITSKAARDGLDAARQIDMSTWTPEQIARFATNLTFGQDTWDWLATKGHAAHAYWRSVRTFWKELTLHEVLYAVEALHQSGRGYGAVEVIGAALHHKITLDSSLVSKALEFAGSPANVESLNQYRDVGHTIQELVKELHTRGDIERAQLARIEWSLLPFLDSEMAEVGPETLQALIASEPSIFVELVSQVFRAEGATAADDPKDDETLARLHNSYRLLRSLAKLPGATSSGSVDLPALRAWIEQVRSLSAAVGRRVISENQIGELIARSTYQTQGDWPAVGIMEVMESIGTDELFRGFVVGVLNARGATCRDSMAGGDIKREMARYFRQLAARARPISLRLANAFHKIAEHYEADAKGEDIDAERRRLGR